MPNIYDGFFSIVNGLKSKVLIIAPETFHHRPLITSLFPSFMWIGVIVPSNPIVVIFYIFVMNHYEQNQLGKE